MPKKTSIYKKLESLAKEFRDYSYELFGWQNTYIHKNIDKYELCFIYSGSIGRCYFANESNHTSIRLGKDPINSVSIDFFEPATISFSVNIDLEETLKEYTQILAEIKQNHKANFENEAEKNKSELKEVLLKKLKELE